ncbi:MAG TPA: hypothetical protein VNX68_16170 [Nitrosopumilaceae archaeon]|jgi:hypothetical protein|nr:hypothetical protein [Nitrosopumilaceae archaeon]
MKIKNKIAKLITIVFLSVTLTACEPSTYTIDGNTYQDYGLLNQNQNQDTSMEYEPEWGNIIIGSIFFETIIAPIYVFGFHCMGPVRKKHANKI